MMRGSGAGGTSSEVPPFSASALIAALHFFVDMNQHSFGALTIALIAIFRTRYSDV